LIQFLSFFEFHLRAAFVHVATSDGNWLFAIQQPAADLKGFRQHLAEGPLRLVFSLAKKISAPGQVRLTLPQPFVSLREPKKD
jgi:hypothetical protein